VSQEVSCSSLIVRKRRKLSFVSCDLICLRSDLDALPCYVKQNGREWTVSRQSRGDEEEAKGKAARMGIETDPAVHSALLSDLESDAEV
jgi:hypothetical protein